MTYIAVLWLLVSMVLGRPAEEIPPKPETLRVCADPDYLPYSNRAGQGFENSIAEAVANALGTTVQYTWAPSRRHGGFSEFLSSTLDAGKCDVVMNIPYGSREELTTRPYYISSYVFVFKKARNLSIVTMDSPVLKLLRIGFESGTPAEDGMRMRGLLNRSTSFDIAQNSEESPASMITALETDKIDVLITWEPAIGTFLKDRPGLEVLPVPNSRTLGAPEQYVFPMSMGVREGDVAMQNWLDSVIATHQTELNSILERYGVKFYDSESALP